MARNNNMRFVIVASEFYQDITDNLIRGAESVFRDEFPSKGSLVIHRIPGSNEIPGTVQAVIDNNCPDAVITFGCIIRGETKHFDMIADNVSSSLMNISVRSSIPIIFGVLATENMKQAETRSDPQKVNSGGECMRTAIKMLETYNEIKK